MDPDVFPNSIEYWGPNGMVFFRNVQVRWTPWQDGDSRFAVALERPGASADQGEYAGRIELAEVKGRFPCPTCRPSSATRRLGPRPGGGILRQMKWDDMNDDEFDLTGDATGWGINLSTNLKFGERKHVFRGQVAFGEGVQNYWNDAPVDVGIRNNFSNPVTPIVGEALPILGIVAFLDLNLSDKWTSTVGYSLVDIDNSDGQTDSAFKKGQYALANVMYYPVKGVMLGPEIQWASARTSGTASRPTTSGSSSRPSTTSVYRSEASNEPTQDGECRPAAARRGSGGPSSRDACGAGADAGRDPGRPRRGLREVQGHPRGQERRLHPGPRQGRLEYLRHRPRDTDGKVYTAGDIKSEVSIQSISKVFTMALVMEESGVDAIAGNMGVDATGQVFNSIVAVEQYKGNEMNAMVNPGAITATSMVKGASRDEIWKKILATYSDFAGRSLSVNQEVFKSRPTPTSATRPSRC